MKKGLLFIATIFSFGALNAQDCSDLIISEYVEGWSNNKALEIYNPTPNTIDLSQYIVVRYNNGSTSNTSGATASIAIQLAGTIAPYDVHVGVLDKRDPMGVDQEAPVWDSLQARADAFYCPVYEDSYAFYWNGNDAVVLAKGSVSNIDAAQLVDVFGKIGENPGEGWSTAFPYTGNGIIVTKDHSMIRKASVKKGVTNPTIAFFDPMLEYDTIPAVVEIGGQLYGNWFSLGTHTCDCAPLSVNTMENEVPEIYPNPSNGIVYVKNAHQLTNIEVINSLGQTVYSASITGKPVVKIDLGANKGLYFARMTDANGNVSVKRVVVK